MRILIVCHEGLNRSVHIAHQLRYWGHECLCAGLNSHEGETLDMLCDWADRILLVEFGMERELPKTCREKCQVWHTGPDVFERPFNPELLARVRELVEAHRHEYQPRDKAVV